ncbi:hypothetical protein EMIT0P171_10486 [Pseudomonas sp. IT-P171]
MSDNNAGSLFYIQCLISMPIVSGHFPDHSNLTSKKEWTFDFQLCQFSFAFIGRVIGRSRQRLSLSD